MTTPLPLVRSPVRVVGVGLSGALSLSEESLAVVKSATLLVGSQRLISSIQETLFSASGCSALTEAGAVMPEFWILGSFTQSFNDLRMRLEHEPTTRAVVLATGDPLFFGLGRLLLSAFPAEQLIFYPQVSAIQLAFSRLKLPWQDATLVSVHGRGELLLTRALKRGDSKIAVLTDNVLTPYAIAQMLEALELPICYQLWVCENLGAENEQVSRFRLASPPDERFAPLNVVVLLREPEAGNDLGDALDNASDLGIDHQNLPLIGLPDSVFKGYADRPTLMTKREIRLLILGAIAPLNHQVIWDIGAGTGSVSVELSRLCPQAKIYAIEKTAMGAALVAHNAEKLAIAPIQIVQSTAPECLKSLPRPDRVFVGGSSGQLIDIMNKLQALKVPRVVVALATLEHLSELTRWLSQPPMDKCWRSQLIQVNISRSLPVGPLTRFSPLNPVTVATLTYDRISLNKTAN